MMTWTSERSGIASRRMWRTAQTPPAIARTMATTMRNWLRSDHSMIAVQDTPGLGLDSGLELHGGVAMGVS